MYAAPDPGMTVIYVDDNTGEVNIATNVMNHQVKVTKSLREYDTLKEGLPFNSKPAVPQS